MTKVSVAAPTAAPATREGEGEMNRSMTAPAAPVTVLLVGERGDALDTLTLLLARKGYRVLRCNTADDAVSTITRERARVVLVSETILDGGGTDLVHRLRAAEPMIPIILQSATSDSRRRCHLVDDLGLDGVQGENESPERLLELVACVINRSRRLERTLAEQELRSLVLTKLCHGLRTSMHVIHGYAQILRSEQVGAPNEDILTRLSSASEGALELLRRHLGHSPAEPVLALARPGGRLAWVNLEDLVRGACAEAVDQAGPRAVRVRSTVPWSAAFLCTDAEKLRTILTELIVATLKTVRSGEVHLAVEFAADQTRFSLQHYNTVALEEERIGERAAVPPRAFYPVTEASGRVLGVEVATRLSACIGGALSVARCESGGAIFALQLPAAAVIQPDYQSTVVH